MIDDLRALWDLDPDVAHLNHGSFGAVPKPVALAHDALRAEIERSPNRFYHRVLPERIEHARLRAAAFLRADPDGVVLVDNATTGTATVIDHVRLGRGDEILVTDHGYNAVRLAALRACRRAGATLVTQPVPPDPGRVVDAVLAGITDRTKLVVVDHISSATAMLFPVADLLRELRRRGVPCHIDGAHVPGMLATDIAELDPDFWVGNFHKWAFAPRGSAALYVSERYRSTIEPLVVSHDVELGFPASFGWIGTRDYTPWLCLPVALDLVDSLGAVLREHNASLAGEGRAVVSAALGTAAPFGHPAGVSLGIVRLPSGVACTHDAARDLMRRIDDALGVEVLVSAHQETGYLRLSAQAYNRLDEYERLGAGLREMLGEDDRPG